MREGENIDPLEKHFMCQLRSRSEWSVLSDEELERFNAGKVCRKYAKGEELFGEGDPCRGIYCVESGLIAIRKMDAEGHSVLLGRLAEAGSTLGYRPLLAGELHRGTAEVIRDSFVCFLDKSVVMELLGHNPSLGLKFLKMASKELGDAEEEIFQLTTLDLRTRLSHLLLVLIDRYGNTTADGAAFLELPLSRPDMAALVGARPESVSRVIHKLEEDGVALFSGRKVNIPQLDRLHMELEHEHHI